MGGRRFAAIAALSIRSIGRRRGKAAPISMNPPVFSRRRGPVEPMYDKALKLAVFDFDHTLIEGDSLWPFLVYVAGWPRATAALLEVLTIFAVRFLKNKHDPLLTDRRGFVKARLLQRLLKGRKTDDLRSAIEKLYGWQKWKAPVREALLDHYNKGHQIVIASGGLDLYLPDLIRDLPPRALICTRVEMRDGVITGLMPSGNCVRARKAEILARYIEKNGPFAESWGYGNFPHDLPMLALLQHRIIIS
jgi:HAD superfamily phosphoserine phosphatase-like hydrolase